MYQRLREAPLSLNGLRCLFLRAHCSQSTDAIYLATMKVAAVLVTILGVASAFAPQSAGRSSTQLRESLADKVRLSGFCCFFAFVAGGPFARKRAFVARLLTQSLIYSQSMNHSVPFSNSADLWNGSFRTQQGCQHIRCP